MTAVRLKDVDEAAFLLTQPGVRYTGEECRPRYGGHKPDIFFCLESGVLEDADIARLRNEYFNGQAAVEPRTFARKQVDLRYKLREALRKSLEVEQRSRE